MLDNRTFNYEIYIAIKPVDGGLKIEIATAIIKLEDGSLFAVDHLYFCDYDKIKSSAPWEQDEFLKNITKVMINEIVDASSVDVECLSVTECMDTSTTAARLMARIEFCTADAR